MLRTAKRKTPVAMSAPAANVIIPSYSPNLAKKIKSSTLTVGKNKSGKAQKD
jgi:hypothetical protein